MWRRSVIEQAEAAQALTEDEYDGDVVLPLNVPAPREDQWLKGTWTKKPATQKMARDYWHKDCWNMCDYPSECRWGKQYGVQTPVKATTTVPSSPPSTLASTPEPERPKTSFDDILLDSSLAETSTAEHLEHSSRETTGTPEVPSEQTRKPSMDDLLESVKRRKRRSAGSVPSPLASHPPSPTTPESPASAAGEHASTESQSASSLQKAFDDFELDVRKSLERAGGLVTSWASSIRSTAALEEEKAEAFVKGLKIKKGRVVSDVSSDC